MKSQKIPKVETLKKGVWLATIAYAIDYALRPEFDNELSWDGPNFNRQDSSGTRSTVTFGDKGLVGVFRDENSSRLSFLNSNRPGYSLEPYLKGMPEDLRTLANQEALQYTLDTYHGKVQPIITAAFWSEGENNPGQILEAAENWPQVEANGAHLIYRELLDVAEAAGEWQEYFEFSDKQVALLKFLFDKKAANSHNVVSFTTKDLPSFAVKNSATFAQVIETLKGIGIVII